MRKKSVPEPPPEVPLWFMTYSDVITLLMTFFILLLTFATNEPEKFQQIQESMFSGGGATGIAGDRTDAVDRDALAVRTRPRSARFTTRGSEMPAIHKDPVNKSLSNGIAALDESQQEEIAFRIVSNLSLSQLIDEEGRISAVGVQRMRMVARKMREIPFDVVLQVKYASAIPKAMVLADQLVRAELLLPGRIAVGVAGDSMEDERLLRMTLVRIPGMKLP